MVSQLKARITLRNIFILIFALTSFHFFSGLAGCDSAPDAGDTADSAEGTPVDVSGSNPPPAGEGPATDEVSSDDGEAGSGDVQTNNSSVQKVILMVAGGMGPQQVGQVVQYRRLRNSMGDPLALERLMDQKYMGMVTTHSYLDLVSDSAAANSALSCGDKTRNNTVGLDANGNSCETILENAITLNKATGLVTNAKISHPGTSAFASHQIDRQAENQISSDILQNSNINILFGGGMTHMIPQSMKMSDVEECASVNSSLDGDSSRNDDSNLIESAKEAGYQFICNSDQLGAVDSGRVLGIFSNADFPLSPDRRSLASLPSLAQMTEKALEVLDQNENGFFLVVHSGLTQIAAQDNDAGTLLQESLAFDAALAKAMEYAAQNPDTLLLLTSDHDTGGFGFASSDQRGADLTLPSGEHYEAPFNYAPVTRLDLLSAQEKSFQSLTGDILTRLYGDSPDLELEDASSLLVSEVEANTPYRLSLAQAREVLDRPAGQDNAVTQDFSDFYLHDNIHSNLLGRAVSRQTSTVWASGTPTSTPVLLLAMGPERYARQVRGFLDNTVVYEIIRNAFLGR